LDDVAEIAGIPVTGIPVGASAGGDDAEAEEQQLPLAQEDAKDTAKGKEQVQLRMLLYIIYYCCST
jgi:hypothetical protein